MGKQHVNDLVREGIGEDMPNKKIIVFSIIGIVIVALIVMIVIAANFLIRSDSQQSQSSGQNQEETSSIVLNSNGLESASNNNYINGSEEQNKPRSGETTNNQQNTAEQLSGNNSSNASETSETISGQQSEAADKDLGSLYSNNGNDLSAFADSIPSMYDTADNEVKKYKNGGMEQRYSMCKYKNVTVQDKILLSSNSEYERYKITVKSTMYDIVTMSVGSQTPKEKDLIETWDIVVNNSGKIVYLVNRERE